MNLQQLLSPCRRAIDDYKMICEGDKIAVGLSGGKDSIALLYALSGLRRFYPLKFEIVAITIDLGLDYNPKEIEALKNMCANLNVEYHIVKTDIYQILFEERKEKSPCSLCSKMRRGALNTKAIELGCNSLALGHHADDLVETLFLSLFYEGRLSTFEPITYLSRSNIKVIRPMIYVQEKNISAFSKDKPILFNPCPQDKHTKRQYVKDLLNEIKKDIPIAKSRILSAILHPERNHLFDDAIEKFNREMSEKNKKS